MGARAFLAIGSNLGDREAHLRRAVAGMPDVVAVSRVYETDPVGSDHDDPPFLNAVVELDTDLTPHELLDVCRRLEAEAERIRTRKNGPRTLDVDVLLVGDETVDDPPDLLVPHPRMWERTFVLVPLHDLASDLVTHRPEDSGVRATNVTLL